MIVGAGAGYQSPIISAKRTDEPKDTSATDKSDRTDRTDRTQDTQAQFSALMALLGGANSKIRADLLKQVPANDSSLLDKLLAGAQESAGETDAAKAADAARYGMLLGNSTTDINSIIASLQNAKATPATNRISPEVLARIASGKSPSVENLLAVGDTDAAAAKAKLDALLATAGTADAAALAAANALATALAASAANPNAPITGTDGLDPDFKAKLDAVIARMKDEYGSDVTVVETVRSQDRQDQLFAQGRSAPGEVVTWTQDSAHTRGQAADVLVDGKWNNDKGYDLLQQIAKEEGLRTLGAKDPGHLELSADAQAAANARIAKANVTVQTSQNSGVARVAAVASVAQVASIGNATVTSVKSPASTTNNAPINLMAQATRTQTESRTSQDGAKSDSRKEGSADATRTTGNESATLGELSKGAQHKFIGPVDTIERPAPVAGADGAQRVQDIDAMLDQSSSAPVSQIKLEVDGPNGDTQHITVDMRGNTVGTNISTDAASADRMRARVGDLHGALESQGLQVDTVRISTAPRTSNPAEQAKQVAPGDAMRLGGAATSNASDSNLQQQSQRDRSPATRDWEDRQAAREEQRRSGKQPQERQRQQYQEKQ